MQQQAKRAVVDIEVDAEQLSVYTPAVPSSAAPESATSTPVTAVPPVATTSSLFTGFSWGSQPPTVNTSTWSSNTSLFAAAKPLESRVKPKATQNKKQVETSSDDDFDAGSSTVSDDDEPIKSNSDNAARGASLFGLSGVSTTLNTATTRVTAPASTLELSDDEASDETDSDTEVVSADADTYDDQQLMGLRVCSPTLAIPVVASSSSTESSATGRAELNDATTTSPSRVQNLVAKHEELIAAAAPSSTSPSRNATICSSEPVTTNKVFGSAGDVSSGGFGALGSASSFSFGSTALNVGTNSRLPTLTTISMPAMAASPAEPVSSVIGPTRNARSRAFDDFDKDANSDADQQSTMSSDEDD